jgi:hypothetical protein
LQEKTGHGAIHLYLAKVSAVAWAMLLCKELLAVAMSGLHPTHSVPIEPFCATNAALCHEQFLTPVERTKKVGQLP